MEDLILGTELDRQGSPVEIKLAPTLGTSKIVPYFYRGYSKLIDAGHANNFLTGLNTSKVIYADIHGQLAGFIIFDYQQDIPKTTWIVYGGVEDTFQRRGIYQMLHKYLEKQARLHGSRQIHSFVHSENIAMLEVSKAIGKKPVFYKVEMNL
jgi:GNAT superfamily N-acetyltransferase